MCASKSAPVSIRKRCFIWPKSQTQVLGLDGRELNWLLEGLDPRQYQRHEALHDSLT
jgi:hypothetical protein